jgi:tRNA-specific 2-thiouridylase
MKNDKSKKAFSLSKIAVGLSGGVDSGLSAYLLKKQGYDVTGVYIVCYSKQGCRAEQDRKDAHRVALELDIPFEVLDFRKEYKEQVLGDFYREYEKGRTPNPDILCNSVVKFGLFYDWAIENDYDYVATGHYSQTDGKKLFAATDQKKDQSYFLYRLKQEQLSHILFPIGGMLKSEVRDLAKKINLSVAEKADSMGICFVGDVSVRDMLIDKFGVKKGKVILSDGTVVGEHDGYYLFNIGYRGGWKRKLKLAKDKFEDNNIPKLYVTAINKEKNEIVVGKREECMRDEFELTEMNWVSDDGSEVLDDKKVLVKIRNTGEFLEAIIEKISEDLLKVKLKEKEFGVSPGQSGVIYDKSGENYKLFGGGIIR